MPVSVCSSPGGQQIRMVSLRFEGGVDDDIDLYTCSEFEGFDVDQKVFEQERLITIVTEPACLRMKQVISELEPVHVHPLSVDEVEQRWYAQVSPNVDGVYYYQPCTGEMSRTVPPGYMDTSDVRRVAELKVKACVSTPRKYTHVDCAVDNEFVKLVSPMNQKKRSDMMEQKSESLTGINKILLVVVMVCAIYRFAIAPNYGFFSLSATSLVPEEAPSLPLNRVETNTLHNQDASSTKTTTRTSNERHPYFEGLLSQQCISSEIKKCYESSSSLLK